jgi:predicted metal-dependent phosphoesterase TrpH
MDAGRDGDAGGRSVTAHAGGVLADGGTETGARAGNETRAGETRVDLHVKIISDRVVDRAKAAGLDVLVYAPHFEHLSTIRERAAQFSDEELLVVPAREYFTGPWNDRKHVLAIDPDEPIPDFVPLAETMAELQGHDAAVLAPHPEFLTLSLSREDIATHADLLAAVEVYNPKHWPRDNRRARSIARESGLGTYISSYAHVPQTVGEAWVEFETDVASAGDLVDALDRGAPSRMYRRHGLVHELKCRAEFFHLAWENTWKKFERVVLADLEPTNPDHPDYDDRFADLSSY